MTRKKIQSDEYKPELNPQQRAVAKLNIALKCKNENQKLFVRLIDKNQIVIVAGPAGTGKTYVACACALHLLAKGFYKRIIVAKSVTVLEGEDIGFLKGSLKEKMDPIMASFMDNFHKIIGKPLTEELERNELIEITPLAYIRGRSIDDTFIIVDEAQNLTKSVLITAVTRIGDNSKMVLLGDEDQVDIKMKSNSGLPWLIDKTTDLEDFGVMRFSEDDVVRNPIIKRFLNRINSD